MIEDATDRLEFLDPEEFGTTATVGAVPDVPVIFQDEHTQAMGIDGSKPMIWCRTADVAAAEFGTAVIVDGRSWTVAADPRDDGHGMTTLMLELV